MKNLATPVEMVEDILRCPELQARISGDAFIGLLQMSYEQEKAACSNRRSKVSKNLGTSSLSQLLGGGQAL
ncbi:hypothetical protein P9G84_22545 [Brevibacillus centrosporus]|uniref:hypothetical protein n=1 Tax=Brevibacillus centrosporus TaxID=54910 RepID=UPI000F0A32E7|nr:hypothetical protein [Brevibacillus centrosporus]MEC2131709.1 hypothetical protein [Brevibacillus centrosporus]RNB67356.1 hypothetical protein EDM55_20125 [Brevibacillus centrosporus]GED33992.1 hypothetical protein BCE02nite_51330 [Brevibacillus centrosporus]